MAIEKSKLRKLDRYRWLAPRSLREGMRTDALIYADEKLLEAILGDLSIEQAMNVACLPGIVGTFAGHAGYSSGLRISDWRSCGHQHARRSNFARRRRIRY